MAVFVSSAGTKVAATKAWILATVTARNGRRGAGLVNDAKCLLCKKLDNGRKQTGVIQSGKRVSRGQEGKSEEVSRLSTYCWTELGVLESGFVFTVVISMLFPLVSALKINSSIREGGSFSGNIQHTACVCTGLLYGVADTYCYVVFVVAAACYLQYYLEVASCAGGPVEMQKCSACSKLEPLWQNHNFDLRVQINALFSLFLSLSF